MREFRREVILLLLREVGAFARPFKILLQYLKHSAIITLNLFLIPNKDRKPVVWGKGSFVTYCGQSLRASSCQIPHTLSLPNQS